MKKTMYLLMALIILSLTACSESKDEIQQVQPKTYTEYKKVEDINLPVTFTLNEFNLIDGLGYVVTLNDTNRLSFTDGESEKNITDINEEVSVTLNLNNPASQGMELSANILHNNGDITKVYFVVPVAQNNPNALLTCSIPVNIDIFNISSLTSEKAGYEVMRNTDNKIVDIRKTYNKSEIEANGNNIDIIGLYNNHNNIVRLYAGEYNNPDYTQYIYVQTVDVYTAKDVNKQIYEITVADYDNTTEGFIFAPHYGYKYQYTFFIDKKGNIRGFYDNKKSKLSHIIRIDNNIFLSDYVTEGKFVKTSVTGEIIEEINYNELDGGQSSYSGHHDYKVIKSGKYAGKIATLVDSLTNEYADSEDHILIIDIDNNKLIKDIDLKDILPKERRIPEITYNQGTSANGLPFVDWFHANSIEHDERDDTLIISGRHQGVIKITLPENDGKIITEKGDYELKWFLTPNVGFTSTDSIDVSDKLLKPIDSQDELIIDDAVLNGSSKHSDFEWNYAQHSAYINKNGNLIIFDNGEGRFQQHVGYVGIADKVYSRFVEYKIDERNMTVQQVYSFGENNPELYSINMSNVCEIDNEHVYMSSVNVHEGTYIENSPATSYYAEIDKTNNNIVFQLKFNKMDGVGAPFYRIYHINPFDYVNVDYN